MPPFQPIDFGLLQLDATEDLLRLYCAQGLVAPFGFAEYWEEGLHVAAQSHEVGPFEDPMEVLALLDREGLSQLAEGHLPDHFLVDATAWDHYLRKRQLTSYRYSGPEDDAPSLYTGIWQVSFDSGGLAVMELFAMQILVLRNAKGECLSNYCHDLYIGSNGSILFRTSSKPWWVWSRTAHQDVPDSDKSGASQFEFGDPNEERYGPFDERLERFPNINDRDVSLFQGDLTNEMSAVYEQVSAVIEPALLQFRNHALDEVGFDHLVSHLLKNVQGSYRFLHPYYMNHWDLALQAVKQDACAFTFLSQAYQHNLKWVIAAIGQLLNWKIDDPSLSGQLFSLFTFFPTKIQQHPDVLSRILPVCPDLISVAAPVSNPHWIRNAVKESSKGGSVMEYASEDLLSDRGFMLEMAELDWTTMKGASANLLADESFLQEAVARYNSSAERKEGAIEFKQAIESVFHFSKHRHLVIPRMAPALSIEEIENWFQLICIEHAPALLSIIPENFVNSERLWLQLARKIDPEKLICTIPTTLMANHKFAEELLQIRGELILACSSEQQQDESMFLLALKHLKSGEGYTWGAEFKERMRAQVVKHRASTNKNLKLLVAHHCGSDFIEEVWPELFDDYEFMSLVVEKISGGWYECASDRLKAHPAFVDFVLECAEWCFKYMPSAIQNDPKYADLKRRLDANELDELPF